MSSRYYVLYRALIVTMNFIVSVCLPVNQPVVEDLGEGKPWALDEEQLLSVAYQLFSFTLKYFIE